MILTGSICLSDIQKELFKKVKCADGVERVYLNVAILERKEVSKFGHTHVMTCSPKKEERKEGVRYFCGDFKEFVQQTTPTPEQINDAPQAGDNDLPF